VPTPNPNAGLGVGDPHGSMSADGVSLEVWVERSRAALGDVVYALVRVTNTTSEQVTYVGDCPSFVRGAVETRPLADTDRRVKRLGAMEPLGWLQPPPVAGGLFQPHPVLHACAEPAGQPPSVIQPGNLREATLGWVVEATHPYWADDPTVVTAAFSGALEMGHRVKPLDLRVDVPIELIDR